MHSQAVSGAHSRLGRAAKEFRASDDGVGFLACRIQIIHGAISVSLTQGNRGDKPVHFVGSGAPAGFEILFPGVDALMKRMKPGTPEFVAEFQQIMSRCDIVSLGPAPM